MSWTSKKNSRAHLFKDLVGVEFIVPAHDYERHVRHWFDLPKLEDLDN